jgi:hypothetical protein
VAQSVTSLNLVMLDGALSIILCLEYTKFSMHSSISKVFERLLSSNTIDDGVRYYQEFQAVQVPGNVAKLVLNLY